MTYSPPLLKKNAHLSSFLVMTKNPHLLCSSQNDDDDGKKPRIASLDIMASALDDR